MSARRPLARAIVTVLALTLFACGEGRSTADRPDDGYGLADIADAAADDQADVAA